MLRFSEWKPASVMNWNLYPMAANSVWNRAMLVSSSFFFQLKDGEQLYASILPGCSAKTASANCRASSKFGSEVSHQRRSAYGAQETLRAIADSNPPRMQKKPSARPLP